jgi:hypothetical protein
VELLHLVLRNGLPFLKRPFQQGSPHRQPGTGRRATKKIEHRFQRSQGLARPIQADVAEQAMLVGVLLGAPDGIMAYPDRQPIAIAHAFLPIELKTAHAIAITASGIS